MWIVIAVSVVVAWCLLSVPVALIVGRFIAGPTTTASPSGVRPIARDHAMETFTATSA